MSLLPNLKIKFEDLGIVPLLICFPFLYYPKIYSGDTQLWVFSAALLALVTYRTHCFVRQSDILLNCVVILCMFVYLPRNFHMFEVARYAYTLLAFTVFWTVVRRGGAKYFTFAIKWTILLWFLVGIYQYLSIKLGGPADFAGRYVPDRSGVPSLAAEPSFYGSLSVLQIMYLLSDRERNSKFFVTLGFFSVFLSGSMLAMLLMVIPLIKIMQSSRWGGLPILAGVIAIATVTFTFIQPPVRITSILSNDISMSGYLLDPSTNLRAGHIFFTLFESQPDSLLLVNPIDFQAQYNLFAAQSSFFMETQSNYILPSLGELVYGSGLFGMLLVGIVLYRAQEGCRLMLNKVIRVSFILACLLNPIPISNVFLIAYALKRE